MHFTSIFNGWDMAKMKTLLLNDQCVIIVKNVAGLNGDNTHSHTSRQLHNIIIFAHFYLKKKNLQFPFMDAFSSNSSNFCLGFQIGVTRKPT